MRSRIMTGIDGEIASVIAESLCVDVEQISDEKSLRKDLKADSLDVQNLIMGIESHFNISIASEEVTDLETVGDVYSFLDSKISKMIKKESADSIVNVLAPGKKRFAQSFIITLGQTNAEGNVYFNSINALMGETRDIFALSIIPEFKDKIGKDFLLITAETHGYYRKNLYFADKVEVEVHITKILPTSVILHFDIINSKTRELHSEGDHLIVFASSDGKPQAFPEGFRQMLYEYADFG